MAAEYSVSTGDEGQHRCGRCRTFVEAYDLMLGISSTTFGITGSRHWVHLDCVEQHQAQELVDSLDSLLQGYDKLTVDDKVLVSESLQDLSQGLYLHRWEKRKKEGRTQPLHKHQEEPLDSYSSPSPAVAPSSFVSTESIETKTATPWYIVAQQKRDLTAPKRKPEKMKAKPPKKQSKKLNQESVRETEENAEKSEAEDGEQAENKPEEEEEMTEKKKAKLEKKERKEKKKEKKKERKKEKKEKKNEKQEPKPKKSTPIEAEAAKAKKKKPGEILAGGPDKPKTEYWYYCASKRPELERNNPHLGPQGINQELSERWRGLEAEAKAEFEEYHARDKRRYGRQLQEFAQYGSFTLEIEQCDDPNISETLSKQCQTDAPRMAPEKQTQTTLKDLFTTPPVEIEVKPRVPKRPGSFHKGALKPVSRLL